MFVQAGGSGKRCGLEVKGKVLRRLEDQVLPVPKEGKKRPNPRGSRGQGRIPRFR